MYWVAAENYVLGKRAGAAGVAPLPEFFITASVMTASMM
jgi:hypothetical protein